MSSCNCDYCKVFRPKKAEMNSRRSRRLAAKPAVNYYEAPIESEATIRRRDQRRFIAQIARNGRRAQAVAEAAVAREQAQKLRAIERCIAELEQEAEILSAMPRTPPRLQRQAAEAPWAPPHGPALSRTKATGCADDVPIEWVLAAQPALSPPPPLRRTCQLPTCDEWCSYCRENDRIAAANRSRNPLAEPRPAFVPQLAFGVPPPPIGATVVRVPIDLATLTRAALQQIIAAASSALASKP